MALRKQPRSIARELALLSISQVKKKKDQLSKADLDSLIVGAVRTLTIEVQDNLEAASAEIKRSEERLLNSETRANDLNGAREMIQEALKVSQKAVNRLGMAVEFPEFLQLTNQEQVRSYAIELISLVNENRREIEASLENVLVAWQLSRLARIDRDILRIAAVEIIYLEVPERIAINESVELAKRYSDEEGYRFINGVLRRLSDRLKGLPEETNEETIETSSMEEKSASPETIEAKEILEELRVKTKFEESQSEEDSEEAVNTMPKAKKQLPVVKHIFKQQD